MHQRDRFFGSNKGALAQTTRHLRKQNSNVEVLAQSSPKHQEVLKAQTTRNLKSPFQQSSHSRKRLHASPGDPKAAQQLRALDDQVDRLQHENRLLREQFDQLRNEQVHLQDVYLSDMLQKENLIAHMKKIMTMKKIRIDPNELAQISAKQSPPQPALLHEQASLRRTQSQFQMKDSLRISVLPQQSVQLNAPQQASRRPHFKIQKAKYSSAQGGKQHAAKPAHPDGASGFASERLAQGSKLSPPQSPRLHVKDLTFQRKQQLRFANSSAKNLEFST